MPLRKKFMYKVIILGDSGVGKTSLMNQFVNNKFSKVHNVTIGIDFLSKDITVGDDIVTLQIWDTAGQERYWSVVPSFYRAVDCCIIVFDVSSRDSVLSLERFYLTFLSQAALSHSDNFPFVVLGNKVDLETNSDLTNAAKQWCSSKNYIPYYEISAKKGTGVQLVFEDIARRAIQLASESNSCGLSNPISLRPNVKQTPEERKCF